MFPIFRLQRKTFPKAQQHKQQPYNLFLFKRSVKGACWTLHFLMCTNNQTPYKSCTYEYHCWFFPREYTYPSMNVSPMWEGTTRYLCTRYKEIVSEMPTDIIRFFQGNPDMFCFQDNISFICASSLLSVSAFFTSLFIFK